MNDVQLIALSEKAIKEFTPRGYLQCRSLDSNKWQTRWFCLYQNLLFYYENEQSARVLGVIFLEGSYCEKTIHTSGKTTSTEVCSLLLFFLLKFYTFIQCVEEVVVFKFFEIFISVSFPL